MELLNKFVPLNTKFVRANHSKFVSKYIRMIQTKKSVFKEEDFRNKN